MKEIDYFIGCKNIKEGKQRFKVLSSKLHPDMISGDRLQFQKLLRQYIKYKGYHVFGFPSTFEEIIEFFYIFRRCFKLQKIDNEWFMIFSEFIEYEYFGEINFLGLFQDIVFYKLNELDGCLRFKFSKEVSNIISGSIYIHKFITLSNQS